MREKPYGKQKIARKNLDAGCGINLWLNAFSFTDECKKSYNEFNIV